MLIFASALTSGVVEITVGQGDEQKTFYIHKIFFRTKAPIFDKMFSASFKEGLTGSATLPDDSCKAFTVFAKWLYSSKSKPTELVICPLFSHEWTSEIRWEMVETIVFADKYCLDQLSDEIMSLWIKYQARGRLPFEELKKITSYIVANSSDFCKARDFFAYLWAIEMLRGPGKNNCKLNGDGGDDLDEFISDDNFSKKVFNKMRSLASQTKEKWQPVCDYHLHGKLAPCHESNVELYILPFKPVGTETSVPQLETKKRLV